MNEKSLEEKVKALEQKVDDLHECLAYAIRSIDDLWHRAQLKNNEDRKSK